MPVLKVDTLTKTFSSGLWPFSKPHTYTAVHELSFQLEKGEILGFLGPNGAGKTTTIQMLLGTLTPSSGNISYFGREFTHYRVESLMNIGYASGYDRLPARLTVSENLDIVARIYGLSKQQRQERIAMLLHFFKLETLHNRQTGALSAGQATRVLLAKAFIANPQIVLLDEPTASLDPDVAHEVRQFILKQCKEQGTSILVTSHNMDEVTELCDRVLVLKNGTLRENSTPEQLAQSISKVRIHLTISSGHNQLTAYLRSVACKHTMVDHQVTIDLDEHAIAQFLATLSELKVSYVAISIDKPTLEDYFLSIAQQRE